MKKALFLSIVVAIATAMTFISCSEKSKVQETPLEGTGLMLLTAPDGGFGLKSGEEILIAPTVEYTAFSLLEGFIVASYEQAGTKGQRLLDPETASELLSGDTIEVQENCFIAPRGQVVSLYFPSTKQRFAASKYLITEDLVMTLFGGKIGIFKTDKTELLKPTDEYGKIAIVAGTTDVYVQADKAWGKGTLKNGEIVPGKLLTPKELKALKGKQGWSEAPIMILEK